MDIEFQKKWDELERKLAQRFGEVPDFQALLFLIGLQELSIKHHKLSKDQKLEVMHIAVCTLLEPFGYYKYEGRDRDGWPHWEVVRNLPNLEVGEQEHLMKEAMLSYFDESI